jgi:hypothetical protein
MNVHPAKLDISPEACCHESTEIELRVINPARQTVYGLAVDGQLGRDTRRALIAKYMALDGTSRRVPPAR